MDVHFSGEAGGGHVFFSQRLIYNSRQIRQLTVQLERNIDSTFAANVVFSVRFAGKCWKDHYFTR